MRTKYNAGDRVLLPCTIQTVEAYSDNRILYRVKEYPDVPVEEDTFTEVGIESALWRIAEALRAIEKDLREARDREPMRIPVTVGGELLFYASPK